jgi:hypothetical protein
MMLLISTPGAGAPVPIWFAPSQICNIICTGDALAKRRDPDPTIEGENQWTAMLLKR